MKAYDNVNISSYCRLTAFLKKKHVGYEAKKSKVLRREEILKSLKEAPDEKFLMMKVHTGSYVLKLGILIDLM